MPSSLAHYWKYYPPHLSPLAPLLCCSLHWDRFTQTRQVSNMTFCDSQRPVSWTLRRTPLSYTPFSSHVCFPACRLLLEKIEFHPSDRKKTYFAFFVYVSQQCITRLREPMPQLVDLCGKLVDVFFWLSRKGWIDYSTQQRNDGLYDEVIHFIGCGCKDITEKGLIHCTDWKQIQLDRGCPVVCLRKYGKQWNKYSVDVNLIGKLLLLELFSFYCTNSSVTNHMWALSVVVLLPPFCGSKFLPRRMVHLWCVHMNECFHLATKFRNVSF